MIPVVAGLALFQGVVDAPGPVADALARELNACHAAQTAAISDPSPGAAYQTMDGGRMLSQLRRGYCDMRAENWTPQGDRAALTVESALGAWSPGFTASEWRKPFVNERGPSVWTTFEQHDAEGRLIGVIRLIEPTDGARGELSLTYETLRP
jgi:hypothetical protein